ncbi:MAG TPA: hypothetical protein VFS43_42190 [Polyangiaceae bacterium]|nr:hypothetical protein [Polyangiaceae bacterium]
MDTTALDANTFDRIILLASIAFTALVAAYARWGVRHPYPPRAPG